MTKLYIFSFSILTDEQYRWCIFLFLGLFLFFLLLLLFTWSPVETIWYINIFFPFLDAFSKWVGEFFSCYDDDDDEVTFTAYLASWGEPSKIKDEGVRQTTTFYGHRKWNEIANLFRHVFEHIMRPSFLSSSSSSKNDDRQRFFLSTEEEERNSFSPLTFLLIYWHLDNQQTHTHSIHVSKAIERRYLKKKKENVDDD